MGIPKEGVWHQLGEGQREKTTDKMDLRVNWNGCRQHLYSTIVHWIKWEKRGHVSRGCNLDQVNQVLTLTLGTSYVNGRPHIPLAKGKENDCFCKQELPSSL